MERDGEIRVSVKILACRPVDCSAYPQSVQERFAADPYGPGAQETTCRKCSCAVILGPRQAIAYDLDPDEYYVACLRCGTILALLYGEGDEVDVRHLGGR